VEHPNGAAVWLLDATTPGEPRVIATDATTTLRPFRPPAGDEILIVRTVSGATQLVLLDRATGDERVLVTGEPGQEVGGARWSPDGRQVIYVAKPADEDDSRRLYVVDVDGGGGPRQLTEGTSNEFDRHQDGAPGARVGSPGREGREPPARAAARRGLHAERPDGVSRRAVGGALDPGSDFLVLALDRLVAGSGAVTGLAGRAVPGR
jgi:dipeptidyl aminopeptidase/acylaminoacyl peptidase